MRIVLPLLSLIAVGSLSADAAIVVTYAEVPGQFTSTLQNTQVFNFNQLSTGNQVGVSWNNVGVYDQITIQPVDVYGGAGNPNGSNYSLQGAGGVGTTSLNLTTGVGYFGLWWSAGDNQNVLEFYSGATLVARFTTQSLLDALTEQPEYHGNPMTGTYSGGNSGEPYAFVNFFGEGTTTWDKIVFTNTTGSGFESDNHTVRDLTWGGYQDETGPLPGKVVARVSGNTVSVMTAVPEPASAALGLVGMVAMMLRRRRIAE